MQFLANKVTKQATDPQLRAQKYGKLAPHIDRLIQVLETTYSVHELLSNHRKKYRIHEIAQDGQTRFYKCYSMDLSGNNRLKFAHIDKTTTEIYFIGDPH